MATIRVAAFAAAVGAAGGVVAVRRTDVPPFADLLPSAAATNAPYAAWVVLQADDCDSRLDALRALRRPALRHRVSLAIAVLGTEADRLVVAERVAERELGVPVVHAGRELPRAVRALGFRSTPVLVMLDAEHRVHWAAPLPVTLDALARWYAVLPTLVGA
jgi:hypothetical protein